MFQLLILVALYSLAFAYKRLVREGVSAKSRKAFYNMHLYYVIVIILFNTLALNNNFFRLYWSTFFQKKYLDKERDYDSLSAFVNFSTGLILSSVRLFDPYYHFVIKQAFFSYFGIVTKDLKKGIHSKPLNEYLAKSLNIELINIILQAINAFSEPGKRPAQEDQDEDSAKP